jgi:hypothetical protein
MSNTTTYVVISQEAVRGKLEAYFHDHLIPFSKKASETGAVYIVDLTPTQRRTVDRFRGVDVQNVHVEETSEIQDYSVASTMEDDMPFPNIEPDSPDEGKWVNFKRKFMQYTDIAFDFANANKYMVAAGLVIFVVLFVIF